MIAFWNQKEVFIGYSLKTFSEVCDALALNKIDYKHKIVSENNKYGLGTRQAIPNPLGESDYSKTYHVYVHERDYDKAKAVLRNT